MNTKIAVTWYRDEKHFKQAQQMMPDIPGTYQQFLAEMLTGLNAAKIKGIEIIKCPLNLEAFERHCQKHNLEMNGESRARYSYRAAFGQGGLLQKINGSQFVVAFAGNNGWIVTNNEEHWKFDEIADALSALPNGAEVVLGITRNGTDFCRTAGNWSEEEMFAAAKQAFKLENYARRDAGRKRLKLVRVVTSQELLETIR